MNQAIHEAKGDSLDKVFDIARGVVSAGTGANKAKGNYSYSSIASASSNMIAIFPVIASRTISAEAAQMITKYIEQKACVLLTLGLQQANISTAKSGIEYLKQFHQNLDIGGGGNTKVLLGLMQGWVDAYEKGYKNESFIENMIDTDVDYSFLFESDNDFEISSRDMKALMDLMKYNESIQVYDTKLNPVSINDYVVNEFADGTYHVSIKRYNPLNEANGGGLRKEYRDEAEGKNQDGTYNGNVMNKKGSRDQAMQHQADDDAEEEYNYKKKKRDWEEDDRNQSKEDRERRETERTEDRAQAQKEREKREQEERDKIAASRAGANVRMTDMNVKKMNDSMPSILTVRFYQSETASVVTEFNIGVKSKLIPVTTPEILRRIMNDNKDGKKFLNFMRVITGELKASDVIFGIARIKDDLKSTKVKGAYGDMWNLLANRAKAAQERVKHGQNNDFSAITTVAISQDDVDELYKEENFDITNPKNALHFMQSYNLMSFIIVDEATEIVKVLMDDSSKSFEEYGFRQFDREAQDGTYKKLINLMSASK